eukprot:CAMPEP_0170520968 /NCGR_PEP_ID=MMETSP0209-20121228/6304_1 /TAXON_ID=665100 ORGANISM="Litonotus pictus, Strain P1" /NCGR_SAMPLE_ID=MMETSP0209 /ASSEMBLY_ACC=CAM_ASM_000301 /LENGTH=115 /DNA_ID=CAMNT_0010807589 /DNA_START=114 /DNA_END=457 /DNA_ORIENTATION=+
MDQETTNSPKNQDLVTHKMSSGNISDIDKEEKANTMRKQQNKGSSKFLQHFTGSQGSQGQDLPDVNKAKERTSAIGMNLFPNSLNLGSNQEEDKVEFKLKKSIPLPKKVQNQKLP